MTSLATLTGDIVERARQGDQNAMGTIAEVRNSAGQGSAKAKRALAAIIRYCKENPFDRFQGESLFNEWREIRKLADGSDPLALLDAISNVDCYTAATVLADGPPIDLKSVGKSLSGRERQVFFYAIRNGRKKGSFHGVEMNEREQQIANAGKVLCYCRAIIQVRKPGAKISDFSRSVGWELGE